MKSNTHKKQISNNPNLLAESNTPAIPLAEKLRPQTLSDIIGQNHLVGTAGILTTMIKNDTLPSLILWGPPGSGKTSIARLLNQNPNSRFIQISAIFSGVQDLKKIFETAQKYKQNGQKTLLFVDEIHRFNRAQQDGFLPYVEKGTITLIGATTENPSFEINAPLLSRMQVLKLNRLTPDDLEKILKKTEQNRPLPITDSARKHLYRMADGDGRHIINLAETIFNAVPENTTQIDTEQLEQIVQQKMPVYDKNRDGHYDLISALHKSVRGSDPDAALYYLARMIVAGEDPLYIARRLIRIAVEDVGLAAPQAITQAIAAKDAYHMLGSPEGELALAQATVYMATAPKSNALYDAFKKSIKAAKQYGSENPPKHILNAPTKLMKNHGYGDGYLYDHHMPDAFSGQNYFPENMKRHKFYQPHGLGFEAEIKKRLEFWEQCRIERQKNTKS